MIDWKSKFEAGLDYQTFLQRYGRADKDLPRWQQLYERVRLDEAQRSVLAGFVRRMNVLCLAGAWCGDCVEQCPILQRFAEAANGKIDLRFLDRDEHADVQAELSLCGGHRVPVVVLLSEDFHECARIGDRTLAKYRQMAAEQLGAACPTGLATEQHLLRAVTQEWLDQFERIQLMLRLSPRLRRRHSD
ncbi:MAG: thioredoxin family protein [Phycisphaerae bacterium]